MNRNVKQCMVTLITYMYEQQHEIKHAKHEQQLAIMNDNVLKEA